MALYLDEVGLIGSATKNPASVGAPQEVRFAGGPWFSNEEPKVIFLVDIPDHTPTFQVFGKIVSSGLIEKRRLTPDCGMERGREAGGAVVGRAL